MLASALVALAAAVVLALGLAHLAITFIGDKLTPRGTATREAMETDHPRITRQTTMWKTWVGFNASHSLGAILFGLVYGYFALAAPNFFFASPFLLTVGGLALASYLLLAKRYWFRTPFTGVLVASVAYAAGVVAGLWVR
ncbi:MAG: hypothetical protein JNK60_18995 [Acidobacteria bacterium]|nr:hypothetical protein [Acidobacteriota bacterium]